MITDLRTLLAHACSDYVPWTLMSKAESDHIAALWIAAPALLAVAEAAQAVRNEWAKQSPNLTLPLLALDDALAALSALNGSEQ